MEEFMKSGVCPKCKSTNVYEGSGVSGMAESPNRRTNAREVPEVLIITPATSFTGIPVTMADEAD